MKRRLANLALILVSIASAGLLLGAADRLLGLFRPASIERVGILFPPGSTATYSTLEFEFTVNINNLGFRGEDTTLDKKREIRIIALGDSFTYGWGVSQEETWIKHVETELRDHGQDVEVLNLGVPGYNPYQYAETADVAVPLLKPDLVIVELLQMDDLRQLDEYVPVRSLSEVSHDTSNSIAYRLFPNFVRLVARRQEAELSGLNERSESRWKFFNSVWEQQASDKIDSFTGSRRTKFETWPDIIQRAFREGRLNPALLNLDLVWGEPVPGELDVASPLMQERISRCADELVRIKAVADRFGARVVVVSIPRLEYVVPSVWSELNGADKNVTSRMLTTTAPDEAARQACARARVPIVVVTDAFRDLDDPETLYFPYDLHLTSRGHREFGSLIAPHIQALVRDE